MCIIQVTINPMHASPTPTGYIKSIPSYRRQLNEIAAVTAILQKQPANSYWLNRLAAICREIRCNGLTRAAGGGAFTQERERINLAAAKTVNPPAAPRRNCDDQIPEIPEDENIEEPVFGSREWFAKQPEIEC